MVQQENVDVLCVGSGCGGLAGAITAVDAGMSVFVAEPSQDQVVRSRPTANSWAATLQKRWGTQKLTGQTAAYLDELTHDLGFPDRVEPLGRLPINTVQTSPVADAGVEHADGCAPPFQGTAIAQWARECLTSACGVLSSRVSPDSMAESWLRDGTPITSSSIAPVSAAPEMTLRKWLVALAQERGIEIHAASAVHSLTFRSSRPVGAVLDTPDGLRRVSARRGVLIGIGGGPADDEVTPSVPPLENAELHMVGRFASRFARLELLRRSPP